MSSGTISVSPVGVGTGGPSIFKTIGGKVKKAKDQAVEARQEADQRIEQGSKRIQELEGIKEKDRTPDDIEELNSLKQDVSSLKEKRSQKAYFFKKALKFQATDNIRTTMGKFQRDPELQNDPAATEKERFYAKAGMFRPDAMPDVSGREEKNKDIISYVGKGFQMIMDAIDKVKSRVNRAAESTEKTSRTATSTETTTENISKSAENLSNATENVADISKQEVKSEQLQFSFEQKSETEKEKAIAESTAEQQQSGGEEGINVKEVGLGGLVSRDPFGWAKDKVRMVRDVAGRFAGRGRGIRGGVRTPGSRSSSNIRPTTGYSDPIGPQPMNSSTPWASKGAGDNGGMFGQSGFTPRLPSQKLSQGGIISRKKSKTNVEGNPLPTTLTSPTNISNVVNQKMASGGIVTPPSAKPSDVSPSAAVLPTNRGTGKKLLTPNKSDAEGISKLFDLYGIIPGVMGFAGIATISKALPFAGAILGAARPVIEPLVQAFGLPASILGMIFGGEAKAASSSGLGTNLAPGVAGPNAAPPGGAPPGGAPPPPGGDLPMGPSMTATGGSIASGNIYSGFRTASRPDHNGIDISGGAWQQGAAISVIKPGVVHHVGDHGNESWGKHVVIKHDDGTYSLYGHLSQVNVRKGDKIENKSGAAKVIGKVGSTGRSEGPHLHFELGNGWNGTILNHVDPTAYIDSYTRAGGQVKVDAIPVRVAASPASPATPSLMPSFSSAGGLGGGNGLTLPLPSSPYTDAYNSYINGTSGFGSPTNPILDLNNRNIWNTGK